MPLIDLRPIHAYTDARFLVKLEGAFGSQVGDNLTCVITHKIDVAYANGTQAYNLNSRLTFTLQGNRTRGQNYGVTNKCYTFVPANRNEVRWDAFIPPNGPVNPQPPLGAALSTMQITLVFEPAQGSNEYFEKKLVIPVGDNWQGTIQIIPTVGAASAIKAFGRRKRGLPSVYGLLRGDEDAGATRIGVEPKATYPVHFSNEIKFYNDASKDGPGMIPGGAFYDIIEAIRAARKFIFVVDWSFHPTAYLKRDPQGVFPPVPDDTYQIGKMLIRKARGLDLNSVLDPTLDPDFLVAIHTWDHVDGAFADDPDNNSAGTVLNQMTNQLGFGAQRPNRLLWRTTERYGTLLSHHQKFIAVDVPVPGGGNRREIKVFFGGLDLTTGRYDWSDHPISGLTVDAYINNPPPNDTYKDWYSPELKHEYATGLPRQPWHDIYAQLVGPAAWDFVLEFVGRWSVSQPRITVSLKGDKDPNRLVYQKFEQLLQDPNFIKPWDNPPVVPAPVIPGILAPVARPWAAQVYRSMEKDFWYKEALTHMNFGNSNLFLQWGLSKDYEKSIHKAYLQAIRLAERFIYIETQYLIGGGPVSTNGDVTHSINDIKRKGVVNRIPELIVKRIAEKHEVGQDFHVYIVVPLYPEGEPDDGKLRPVRYFQWQTMRWMQQEVARQITAIDTRLGHLPSIKTWEDYLSFYFLGNRSAVPTNAMPVPVGRKNKLIDSHRYMIYVHSKLMIVDDEYIILGSANLNERSMAGKRDSEICVGMWASPGNEAQCTAEIRAFRRELWNEHLGAPFVTNTLGANYFNSPHLPLASLTVRAEANANRQRFINGTVGPMGHLMSFDMNAPNALIPDSRDTGDAWRIQPQARGSLAGLPQDGFR
jgi:phosphatidylserine/phosphatidylglycerophosphate/cardiolipin synthase-like enzyme